VQLRAQLMVNVTSRSVQHFSLLLSSWIYL
jgi:hypothetical protein